MQNFLKTKYRFILMYRSLPITILLPITVLLNGCGSGINTTNTGTPSTGYFGGNEYAYLLDGGYNINSYAVQNNGGTLSFYTFGSPVAPVIKTVSGIIVNATTHTLYSLDFSTSTAAIDVYSIAYNGQLLPLISTPINAQYTPVLAQINNGYLYITLQPTAPSTNYALGIYGINSDGSLTPLTTTPLNYGIQFSNLDQAPPSFSFSLDGRYIYIVRPGDNVVQQFLA